MVIANRKKKADFNLAVPPEQELGSCKDRQVQRWPPEETMAWCYWCHHKVSGQGLAAVKPWLGAEMGPPIPQGYCQT